jgi:hypothetical protein
VAHTNRGREKILMFGKATFGPGGYQDGTVCIYSSNKRVDLQKIGRARNVVENAYRNSQLSICYMYTSTSIKRSPPDVVRIHCMTKFIPVGRL